MNYYDEIKQKLIDNEIYTKVKDYSKERNRVITYFEICRLLNEACRKYGESIIGQYSDRLMNEVGKKYDKSTLFRMQQFYIVFSNEKVALVVHQLTWSHCLLLLSIMDINKLNYYINQISSKNLAKRQLREVIKSNEYERLDGNTKLKLINKEKLKVEDLIKNINNIEIVKEKVLQKLILEDIILQKYKKSDHNFTIRCIIYNVISIYLCLYIKWLLLMELFF